MHGNAHLWCNINQALLWFQSINITENPLFFSEILQILLHIPRHAKAHDQYFVTTAILCTNKYRFILINTQPVLCNTKPYPLQGKVCLTGMSHAHKCISKSVPIYHRRNKYTYVCAVER